jgi:glycosyltransferase involved in cell wall biosynthesis
MDVAHMHIVLLHFYSHSPTPAYQEIAAALRKRGHTVWVGARDTMGDLAWQDEEHTFEVTRGPSSPSDLLVRIPFLRLFAERVHFLGFILRVRSFLRDSEPDIVQVNHASVRWLAVLPLFMPRQVHFVLDFRQVGQRGAKEPVGRFKGWLMDSWRRFCSRYIYDATCFLHQAGARKILGQDWPKWGVVVPLGVCQRFLDIEDSAFDRRDDLGPVKFLYIGTLSRVRHLEQILFAVQQALLSTRDFRIDFIGSDSSQGFYEELIGELELDSVVKVLPPVPYQNVPEVIASYDVALAYVPERPAHWLYQPTMKVLEYRAVGTPIMASDNEPNRDIVRDGENGILVLNTPESLAGGFIRFVLDRAFLARCQLHARQMRQGETWDQVAGMYEQDIYQTLVGVPLRAGRSRIGVE